MVLKYKEAVQYPFKMKANRELMMLQKYLLSGTFKTHKQEEKASQPVDL
jgi:hypothetical protein